MSDESEVLLGTIVNRRQLNANHIAVTVLVRTPPGGVKTFQDAKTLGVVPMSISAPKLYGEPARELYASAFFDSKQVLGRIGTPEQYSTWVKKQRCRKTRDYGHPENPVVPAHYRTVADGAGTGQKNDYGEIPLRNDLHNEQHQKGYSALGGKEQFQKWLRQSRRAWGSEVLLSKMGFESFAQVPPIYFYRYFIQPQGLEKHLPTGYKQAVFHGI